MITSIILVVLAVYSIFMTLMYVLARAEAISAENIGIMRLHERDKHLNKQLAWQAEAMKTLDEMKEKLEEGMELFDKLEEADERSRDLARLNADLVATVMVFKSRFPHSFEIAMSEIEKGQSLIENGELRIEKEKSLIEDESGVLRTLDKGTTASACNGGVSATA